MKHSRSFVLLTVALMMAGLDGSAQALSKVDSLGAFSIPGIDTWNVHSSIIDDDFTIYVLRTRQYDTTKVKFPVLYMTDGDWNMTVAMNCFSMLRQDYVTHEPLIVGIGYGKGENKRSRDLDPSGGGPKFLAFIEKEVTPFISQHYRTADQKAIYGYSLGGMFTTYVLFTRPELFDMVFIGAPGNNGTLLMPAARTYFKGHKTLKSKVFAGVGSYEKLVVKNIDSLRTFLLAQKSPDLKIRTDITPDANHGGALAAVMQNAIAFGYCDRRQAIPVPLSTLTLLKGKYISQDKEVPNLLITVEKNKLFGNFDREGSLPNELLAASPSEYFMAENEMVLFTFKKEAGKDIIIAYADNKEFKFVK